MSRIEFRRQDITSVVTGAGSGIGAATALQIAARGGHLALVDRNQEAMQRVAEQATGLGVRVSTHVCDISDGEAVSDLPIAVVAQHGGAQVLVNAAGVSLLGSFQQVTLDEFKWLLDINLWGTISVCKAFLPMLSRQAVAHIANLSSGYGLVAPAGRVPYATAKFGIRGFTEALRSELAGGPISVCAVYPGGIKTGIMSTARVAKAMDPEAAAAAAEAQTAAYRTTPETAGKRIADAIERRQGRLLIGADAVFLDWLGRLLPTHYGSVLSRLLARASGL